MKRSLIIPAVMALSVFGSSTILRAADQAPASAAPTAAAPAAAPQGSIEVMKFVLTSSVQDREPGAEITTAKVGDTVVAWTQIRSGMDETSVTHRWLHEADNAGDVSLTVKSSPWRTWSRKTVSEPGNWKVQVLDASGAVLKEASFTVTAQ